MRYCTNCGKQLEDDAKFCSVCGKAVNIDESTEMKKKVEYNEKIFRCPSCGKMLSVFEVKCPACGYEIRDASVAKSLKHFSYKLENAQNDKEKATIIRHFPIPNDKENIWEFLILAATNIDGKTDSEISDAWLVKLEQVVRKAKLILDDKESGKVEKQYDEILKKFNKEKAKKNARETWNDLAESVQILPQFIIIFVWILSMMIFLPKCRIGLDVAGTNGYQLFMILIYIAGAVFIPLTLRCNFLLPKLEVTVGIVLSIVLMIPLLKENLDVAGTNAFHLLIIIYSICIIIIIVRVVKNNKKKKESERNGSFNLASLIIVLISMVIWLTVYTIGSVFALKYAEGDKTSPVIADNVEDDDQEGIHSYEVRNYVGKNVASIGKINGNKLVDEYGDAKVNLVFFTEDGMFVSLDDEDTKKNYVVVGQNTKSGSKITVVNQRDSSGKPYSTLVDYQSVDEIILYISPLNTTFNPQITEIAPTLDKHKYHIKDYVGRNAASFGQYYGSDRVDVYNNAKLKLSFSSVDESFVDSDDLNILKNYIIVSQDIAPNTELTIEYDKDSSGKEYDSLINSQKYEEITFVVKKLDTSIVEKMPQLDSKRNNSDNEDKIELSIKYKVISGGKAEITGYKGDGNHVTIDSKIDGHEVVSIGKSAFKDCKTLKSVSFLADVDVIDDYAFAGCTSLTDISIPIETTRIGAHAFEDCTNLSELIIWGNPEIDDYAFAGCESIVDLSISYDTKRVGAHAFDGCDNLESVIVWDDNTIIEKDAFANCPKLKGRPIQE